MPSTKIFLCSDLHTNFYDDAGKELIESCRRDVDVVVVAGDLSNSIRLERSTEILCDLYPQVVYVAGNHDYYHSSFEETDELLYKIEATKSNFNFLNNDRRIICGVPFIGATLWFPRSPEAEIYGTMLNDFRCIHRFRHEVYDKHEETVEFFNENMVPGDIVVTHHLPVKDSVPTKWKNSPLNCFFSCNLVDLIADKTPQCWFHGHTHYPRDYKFILTRIVANPFGYPYENIQYDKSLVIEIDHEDPYDVGEQFEL